jgi:hypothetical protein
VAKRSQWNGIDGNMDSRNATTHTKTKQNKFKTNHPWPVFESMIHSRHGTQTKNTFEDGHLVRSNVCSAFHQHVLLAGQKIQNFYFFLFLRTE